MTELIVTGGFLVDPAHGISAAADIGIADGRVCAVTEPGRLGGAGAGVIDASGLIVAPGFIDLHSHAQNPAGHRLQALDGVTTSLELEAGATPLARTVADARAEGRMLNFGYSAGWLLARAIVLEDLTDAEIAALPTLPLDAFAAIQSRRNWQRPADAAQVERIVALVSAQLDAGALGIGVLLGYAPRTGTDELAAVAALAGARGVPLFVHARDGVGGPTGPLDELVELSGRFGVQVHVCHCAATFAGALDEVDGVLSAARARDLPVSVESYPFGSYSTVIGADFLDPGRWRAAGISPALITYLPTGERIADYDRLADLRAQDPGGLCIAEQFVGAEGERELLYGLTLPGSVIASDAMPLTAVGGRWATHPRSTSCFTRAIAWLHRDTGALTLPDVIARCTSGPARIVRSAVPEMADRGHLGVGAVADVTIFDLAALRPATRAIPATRAHGVRHVLVGGLPVVRDGMPVPDVAAGRWLRGSCGGAATGS